MFFVIGNDTFTKCSNIVYEDKWVFFKKKKLINCEKGDDSFKHIYSLFLPS